VGCTLAGSLTNMIKDIKRTVDPDYLFIEPFELVVTKEILTALAMGQRDVVYEVGPVFALMDAPEFDYLWQERKQTLINYISGCHRVAITRVDLVDQQKLEQIRETLRNEAQADNALAVSIPDDQGIEKVIADFS
jgi:G3E family GTPase